MITIEVSVLIPVLFFLCCMLILFQFFLVDMAAAKSEAMRVADEAAAAWKGGGDLVTNRTSPDKLSDRDLACLKEKTRTKSLLAAAGKRLSDRLNTRMILAGVRAGDVRISDSRVTVRAGIFFQNMGKGIRSFFGIRGFCLSFTGKAALDDWEESLRKGSAIETETGR